ncbi:uncharacterized protein LOC117779472 [Drosophila innubila]|uniref:uncharacterized protein LOC117779472 n=1 Tax=Drosophila innubila TaxID=198719 RepID=UPI00148C6DE2|nr:uncharacterized protein LOC117779472 [Drosophila innubila]
MCQLSIVILLSFIPFALLQTEDPHLCEKYVTVHYMVRERTPLQDYGKFAEDFTRLNIQGAMRNVIKTKLEVRKNCCPGYAKSDQLGLGCQPVQTTTDSTTGTWTDSDETTTLDIVTNSISPQQKPSEIDEWISICATALVLTTIVVITLLSLCFIRRRRRLNVNNDMHESGNELEARVGLFSDSLRDS